MKCTLIYRRWTQSGFNNAYDTISVAVQGENGVGEIDFNNTTGTVRIRYEDDSAYFVPPSQVLAYLVKDDDE